MAKYREKVKNDRLIVKTRLSSAEVIEDREFSVLESGNIKGLLKLKKGWWNSLEYTGPSGLALSEHLKKPVTKYEFFYIMAQITGMVKKIHHNNLFLNNLVLDLRYVFINENTEEMQFIYLPIAGNHVALNVTGFMESIVYTVIPAEDRNCDYIAKYTSFLKSLREFNAELIERYITESDKDVGKQIKKQNAGQSGFITDSRKDYYEHYGCDEGEDDTEQLIEEETGLLEQEDEDTGLLKEGYSGGTEVLMEMGTDVLVEDESILDTPTLTRISTGEVFHIDKPVFRLGKERSYVDYFVSNNNAISRSHADIITRGQRYYVIDLNSTNHTYINGMILPIKLETEMKDGDILKLAAEEFVFHL